jgi:hypothetical protein
MSIILCDCVVDSDLQGFKGPLPGTQVCERIRTQREREQRKTLPFFHIAPVLTLASHASCRQWPLRADQALIHQAVTIRGKNVSPLGPLDHHPTQAQ